MSAASSAFSLMPPHNSLSPEMFLCIKEGRLEIGDSFWRDKGLIHDLTLHPSRDGAHLGA
jgi:hypothetical protein